MAVAKTLGFDLCPRLSSMRDRQLHVPRGFAIPKELAPIVRADVSTEAITEGWDAFLRIVATIEQG